MNFIYYAPILLLNNSPSMEWKYYPKFNYQKLLICQWR